MWTRNYGALGQTARVCFGVLCANRTREDKRDFGDLRIRRSEGRVVNTPLVFKRVLFEERGRKRRGDPKGEVGEKKDKRVRERERMEGGGETEKREGRRKETERESGRESDAHLEWKKGLSPEIGVKKTMNTDGVEYGNRN
ncbi:hypothetical protein TNCV_1099831 [Trichonephila clavipes]|nr:hypothetical protein TNCV_1099831 [Trichonephila clavipes]